MIRTFMIRTLVLLAMCAVAYGQTSPQSPAPSQGSARVNSGSDANLLLPNLAPLPRGKTSLIGGLVRNVDRVQDQLTLYPFGGHDIKILFDERTLVYRGQQRASQRDLRNGERVYVETTLDGGSIFARSIHLAGQSTDGECRGQVVSYDRGRGELVVRDTLSPEPVTLKISGTTSVTHKGQEDSAQLEPGALVDVQFQPDNTGEATAREVTILATPGTTFTFVGEVEFLDLHRGVMSLTDPRDKKSYDIAFTPSLAPGSDALREGSEVTVTASFDGRRYVADSIAVNPTPGK